MSQWTQADVDRIMRKRAGASPKDEPVLTPTRAKYGNRKVEIDGIWFDSQKEGNRYRELKARLEAKEIERLQLQPMFEVVACCKFHDDHLKIGEYHADFSYQELVPELRFVIEDVKSKATRTQVYQLRKKLVEIYHDIIITEI